VPNTLSVIVEQDDVLEEGDGGAIVDSMESLFAVALVSFLSLSPQEGGQTHEALSR
jgi:hypothetical protein